MLLSCLSPVFAMPRSARSHRRASPPTCLIIGLLVGGSLASASCVGLVEAEEGREHHPEGSGAPGLLDPVAALLVLPAMDSATEARALALADSAAFAFREERWEAALVHYRRLGEAAPVLSDWLPVFQAEVMARRGDPTGMAHIGGTMPESSPPWERWGWQLEVEALERSGEPGAAAQAAEAAARHRSTPEAAAESLAEAARLLEGSGDLQAAFRLRLEALARAPGSPAAGRALAALPSPLPDFPILPEQERGVLLAAARATGAHERLVEFLPAFIQEAETRQGTSTSGGVGALHPAAPLRLELAEALLATGAPGRVGEWLAPLEWTEEAQLILGRAHLAQGRRDQGITTLLRVGARHAESPEVAGAALLEVAGAEAERGNDLAALDAFRRAYELQAHDATAEVTAIRLASRLYLRRNLEPTVAFFASMAEYHPRPASRQLAAFWKGLTLESSGRGGEATPFFRQAHALDPLGYYGLIAGERTGEPILPTHLPLGPPPSRELDGQTANALFRLRIHQRVPTPGSLAFELARLEAHFSAIPGGDYAWAEALIEGGFPLQGVVLGRAIHAREREWNLRLLRIVHPFPHREVILREASARGLDPFLVAGLIRQESLFHPSIRSSAGAVGLMQIMPATGAEVARGMGMSGYSTARLVEPEVNVALGTRFLAQLLQRFDGQVTDALAAYNAGPTRARNWRGMPEYADRDVFHEHIPFRETRHYVKVVQQYARVYAALYGCADFSPCLGLTHAAVTSATLPHAPEGHAVPAR